MIIFLTVMAICYTGIALWVAVAVIFGLSMVYQHSPQASKYGGWFLFFYIVPIALIFGFGWPLSLPLMKYTKVLDKL